MTFFLYLFKNIILLFIISYFAFFSKFDWCKYYEQISVEDDKDKWKEYYLVHYNPVLWFEHNSSNNFYK